MGKKILYYILNYNKWIAIRAFHGHFRIKDKETGAEWNRYISNVVMCNVVREKYKIIPYGLEAIEHPTHQEAIDYIIDVQKFIENQRKEKNE